MNDAERRKFDEAESNGLLQSLRARVNAFCLPLWWEKGRKTILGNGSMVVVATPRKIFGVTADHVVGIYERHRRVYSDVFCQLGNAPFDPLANVLARSAYWDLATFEVPASTLNHWGRDYRIYRADDWPPRTISSGDPIVLGGYPVNRRSQSAGDRPATMSIDFISFIARADNWSESHMSFCFDSSSWYWPQGVGLDANPELSGASGGPCFVIVPEEDRIELAGFVYEAHTEYEVIRVRQANLIRADGTIVPAPPGALQPVAHCL